MALGMEVKCPRKEREPWNTKLHLFGNNGGAEVCGNEIKSGTFVYIERGWGICVKHADVRHVRNVESLLKMAFAVDVAKSPVVVLARVRNRSDERKTGYNR